MDEILTHSLVASFAYAFHVNRSLDPVYAERADFWTDYLENHFEAKWREREGIRSDFPFLEKKLTHAYVQWIRYHYYMHGLTGREGYYDEAVRMADVIGRHVTTVSTPLGTAAQWDHGMPIIDGSSHGMQRTNYARYTVQGMADLACEGFSVFAESGFMEQVATMEAHFVMDSHAPDDYAYRIDGSGPGGESLSRFGISPWTQLGRWDASGRVVSISDEAYENLESSSSNPRRIFIPAGMVFSLQLE
jgi:hypothetical protein